jgi:hypothetical protein
MACDVIAVTLTGSRKAYAACLARLATLPPTNGHALPIVAAVSASGVRRRIVRVLAFDAARAGRFHVVAASVAAVALLTLSPYASALRVVAAHPAAEQAPRAPVPPDVATAGAVPVEASSSSPLPPRPVTGPGDRTAITAAPNAAPVPAAAATMRRASEAQPVSVNTTVMTAAEAPAFLSSRQLGATTIDPPATVVASAAAAPRAGPALASAAGAAPGAGGQSTGSPVTVSPPWTAAAGAGVAIGDTAQSAAQATAGFFNRLGRKIAGSL